jgi:hypothetical protein
LSETQSVSAIFFHTQIPHVMKDLSSLPKDHKLPHSNNQFTLLGGRARPKLAGFAKVLAGGRVVKLDNTKKFDERFLGCDIESTQACNETTSDQAILETVVSNLEAGVQLIGKQELSLAKFGGRLAEIALALNKAREIPKCSTDAQSDFERSRDCLRSIARETFDHTALFSNGPSRPITIAVPARNHWEGLSIDRCDLAKPGLLSIDRGKVCPRAVGILLDRESIQRAFEEWRFMCVNNFMQSHLVNSMLKEFLGKLKGFIGGKRWIAPPFPNSQSPGPLRRPNLEN